MTTTATLPTLTATVETRSQHSRGSSAHRFGGPDTYVAVVIAPEGVQVPRTLRGDVLANRGIQIKYCGEGYSQHSGARSMLGAAIEKASRLAARINTAEAAWSDLRHCEMY
jgi:hypothetical protein